MGCKHVAKYQRLICCGSKNIAIFQRQSQQGNFSIPYNFSVFKCSDSVTRRPPADGKFPYLSNGGSLSVVGLTVPEIQVKHWTHTQKSTEKKWKLWNFAGAKQNFFSKNYWAPVSSPMRGNITKNRHRNLRTPPSRFVVLAENHRYFLTWGGLEPQPRLASKNLLVTRG